MAATAAEIKSCCASAYSGEAARWLLGDRFHPGGARLTSRLAEALQVGPGGLVVDVASGSGASTLQVARETGCDVVGIELSPGAVNEACRQARRAGLASRARFIEGDAESLPLGDGTADGVICECALCTFPDKPAAAAEFARVLRPGGRVALSDMVADRERLPDQLRTLEAWVSCFADARPLAEIAALLAASGLEAERLERHDAALGTLLDRVEARFRVAGMLGTRAPESLAANVERGLGLVAAARDAVADGALGYGVVVARRGDG